MDAYEQKTIEAISNYLKDVKKKPTDINLESELYSIDIDSLDTIELGFILEEKYSISIEIEKLMSHNIKTVGDVAKFVRENDKKS